MNFIGQNKIIKEISQRISLSKRKGVPLGNLLFVGPHDIGKKTLSIEVSKSLGQEYKILDIKSGIYNNVGDLIGVFTNLDENSILIIEDIDLLGKNSTSLLEGILTDNSIEFIFDKGVHARSHKYKLPSFSIIATTANSSKVHERIRRWFSGFVFDEYSQKEIFQIIEYMAKLHGVDFDETVLKYLSARCQGLPGNADVAIRLGKGKYNTEKEWIDFLESLFVMQIDKRNKLSKVVSNTANLKNTSDFIVVKKNMIKIFISYAKEDLSKVKPIYNMLKKEGYKVWIDFVELIPGQEFDLEIQKAIETSDIFLAILSKNSVDKKGYFQKELKKGVETLEYFPAGQIYFIPVRIENCDMPLKLNSIQWCNYYDKNGKFKLLQAINESFRK